jgi:hypothetical protein|tara:strand:- start:8801 stop:9712 length:912 start_codon:yes stop_codon:yes gene_type:complete
MASTYTTNLRLTKQGDGDNPNTWGQVLNNVISLVDQAVASYTTVSLGSAATVTLTENQGSQDQSRSAILEFKGSVGGANTSIIVLVPNTPKTYAIRNVVSANTTATDAIVLRVAGNAGVTVGSGNGYYITNGTSCFSVVGETGTAAARDVGVCATEIPDTSLADIRYVQSSVASSITAKKTFVSTVVFDGIVSVSGPVKSFITTLTDAASVAVSMNTGNNFLVTLGGNRTLAAPSNPTAGQTGSIYVVQDSTGSRTLSYNTVYKFPGGSVPVATTTGGAVDMLIYNVRSATTIDTVMLKDFKR